MVGINFEKCDDGTNCACVEVSTFSGTDPRKVKLHGRIVGDGVEYKISVHHGSKVIREETLLNKDPWDFNKLKENLKCYPSYQLTRVEDIKTIEKPYTLENPHAINLAKSVYPIEIEAGSELFYLKNSKGKGFTSGATPNFNGSLFFERLSDFSLREVFKNCLNCVGLSVITDLKRSHYQTFIIKGIDDLLSRLESLRNEYPSYKSKLIKRPNLLFFEQRSEEWIRSLLLSIAHYKKIFDSLPGLKQKQLLKYSAFKRHSSRVRSGNMAAAIERFNFVLSLFRTVEQTENMKAEEMENLLYEISENWITGQDMNRIRNFYMLCEEKCHLTCNVIEAALKPELERIVGTDFTKRAGQTLVDKEVSDLNIIPSSSPMSLIKFSLLSKYSHSAFSDDPRLTGSPTLAKIEPPHLKTVVLTKDFKVWLKYPKIFIQERNGNFRTVVKSLAKDDSIGRAYFVSVLEKSNECILFNMLQKSYYNSTNEICLLKLQQLFENSEATLEQIEISKSYYSTIQYAWFKRSLFITEGETLKIYKVENSEILFTTNKQIKSLYASRSDNISHNAAILRMQTTRKASFAANDEWVMFCFPRCGQSKQLHTSQSFVAVNHQQIRELVSVETECAESREPMSIPINIGSTLAGLIIYFKPLEYRLFILNKRGQLQGLQGRAYPLRGMRSPDLASGERIVNNVHWDQTAQVLRIWSISIRDKDEPCPSARLSLLKYRLR